MNAMQAAPDVVIVNAGASTSAAASIISVLQDWAVGLLGVPIGVPLAAFSGVLYGLSYRDQMSVGRLWGNLVASTILASVLAPVATLLATRWLGPADGWQAAVTIGLAGAIGFGTQYLHRWLRTRRDRLLDGAVDRFLGSAHPSERASRKDDK